MLFAEVNLLLAWQRMQGEELLRREEGEEVEELVEEEEKGVESLGGEDLSFRVG